MALLTSAASIHDTGRMWVPVNASSTSARVGCGRSGRTTRTRNHCDHVGVDAGGVERVDADVFRWVTRYNTTRLVMHAEAAGFHKSQRGVTGTEPGGSPPGSTATTLTDP